MRALLFLGLLVLAVIAIRTFLRAWAHRVPAGAGVGRRDELVKDPVCQTYVLMSRAVKSEAGGVTTHFCSPECAARFVRGEQRG